MPIEPAATTTESSASRREFLRASLATAAALSGVAAPRLFADGPGTRQESPNPAKKETRSRVCRVDSDKLVSGRVVHAKLLGKALEVGLCALAHESDARDAWKHFLAPDDVVLIKFNQSASKVIGTTPPMAEELVQSLLRAGWPPQQLMLLESGESTPLIRRTRSADLRWQQEEVQFGSSGKDSFLAAIDQATAIINIPFLKTHHRAVMSGCLKNLSHGLIRHPVRFHANGCDPAIAEIAASDRIRSKLRLNIVNAIRVVFDRGPEATESEIHNAGTLLFAQDPVACDTTCFSILNAVRSLRLFSPLLQEARIPPQLVSADRIGLGRADQDYIDCTSLDL